MILAHLLAVSVGSILYVAAGIGLVIFFHELGHFAVAKWCNVCVERFSIGFGPVLWRTKRGETEYALSLIPFGGYVKMLGQDDIDPSQLSSDEIAENPRSYSAKSIPQRMAIISAGVIMNLITGLLFYACAFGLGIENSQPVVGHVEVGLPAWEAGIDRGDRVLSINGESIAAFDDIMLEVALSPSNRHLFDAPANLANMLHNGPVSQEVRDEFASRQIRLPHDAIAVADTTNNWSIKSGTTRMFVLAGSTSKTAVSGNMLRIQGTRDDVEKTWNVLPHGKGTGRRIGLHAERDTLFAGGKTVGLAGWPAADSKPAIANNDRLRKIDGKTINSVAEMRDYIARHADRQLNYQIQRGDNKKLIDVAVPARRFRTLGLSMDIGRIAAIRDGSPAQAAGLEVGDKLITINGQDIGKDTNPLELPNLFAQLHGRNVQLEVIREQPTGEPETVSLSVIPNDLPGWLDQPEHPKAPLAVPALGMAFHCSVNILAVVPDSPAGKAGLEPGEQISRITITPTQTIPDAAPTKLEYQFDDPKSNWAHAVWRMQWADDSPVVIEVVGDDGEQRSVQVTPLRNPKRNWFLPIRGTEHYPLVQTQQADGLVSALGMAAGQTETTLMRIWLTLRSLFTGDISVTELTGPIGIARVAYSFAEQGLSRLLQFLAFLSFNLAVINFLPIPVLDGGHMVFLTWEAVTRRRPSERVLIGATYCGLAFVLVLMVTVIFVDLERIPAIQRVVESVFG